MPRLFGRETFTSGFLNVMRAQTTEAKATDLPFTGKCSDILVTVVLIHCRIIKDLLAEMPDDLPPFETVSHLYGTGITCEGALYDGTTGEEKTRFADFIRADRQKLRDWLSTNIPIEWNKKYERYEEVEKGITVFFTDGTTVSGSILVGADGGHSKGMLKNHENACLQLILILLYSPQPTCRRRAWPMQPHSGRYVRRSHGPW